MKSFQFKDLTVTLEQNQANQALCVNPSIYCRYPSIHCGPTFQCIGCTYHISCVNYTVVTCPANTRITCPFASCGISEITTWKTTSPIIDEVDHFQDAELVQFKDELAQLQKYVDEKLQRAPEELDQLESKLSAAIEEVRAKRENIAKGR